MLVVKAIIGSATDPRFAGRRVERLSVDWSEAGKRRLRRATDAGTDVAIDVPRGTHLADGAVLDDDGERIVVIERRRTPALVLRLDPRLAADERIRAAALVGHAFGNQHVPLEVYGDEIRVPLTTSEAVARRTVERLALDRVEISVEPVALAARRPLAGGPGHGHGGGHDGHG